MEGKTENPPVCTAPQPQQHLTAGPGAVIGQYPVPTHVTATVVTSELLGPKAATTTCRSCRAEIVTTVEYTPATKTHIIATILCVFGYWCCVCVPYCKDSCKNADHYCPNCNSYLGTHKS